MPILISDTDYKEYRILQNTAKHQRKINSAKGMVSLEHDIDPPIKRLVALFALLECEPMWSCCGFDYDGQPLHKTHEYGSCFIAFKVTQRIADIVKKLFELGYVKEKDSESSSWETFQVGLVCYLRSDFDYFHEKSEYPWSMKSCIHYPELSLIQIKHMERLLLYYFKDEFVDEVTLTDSNGMQKKYLEHWQYPALEDWVIKKEDYIGEND